MPTINEVKSTVSAIEKSHVRSGGPGVGPGGAQVLMRKDAASNGKSTNKVIFENTRKR